MSDIFEKIDEVFGSAIAKATNRRRRIPDGCTYCNQNRDTEMMPPHDASPRCESGGHNHCSCDICF